MANKDAFAAFRANYPTRKPRVFTGQNADQFRQMTAADGLMDLDGTAAGQPISGPGPWGEDLLQDGKHLWVVAKGDAPFAFELCKFGEHLQSEKIKHTNLTGGAEAYCGGEMWFLKDGRIVINGESGRYGPASPAELEAAAKAIHDAGYEVGLVEWSEDTKTPPINAKSEDDLKWLKR